MPVLKALLHMVANSLGAAVLNTETTTNIATRFGYNYLPRQESRPYLS